MDRAVSQTPPAEVRKILRHEVNFGCPVCGSPFLTWHHFDPPWRLCHHHKTEGMVALCLQHHKEADVGTYTKAQLRALKRNPYLRDTKPKAKFNWRRQLILLEVGSNYYISPKHILRVADNDVIWISCDSFGLQAISMDFRNANGNTILKMEANDWILLDEIEDMECPPSANALIIRVTKEGIRLSLRFRSFTEGKMCERIIRRCTRAFHESHRRIATGWPRNDWTQRILASLPSPEAQARNFWESIREAIPEWPVAVCTIEGVFAWPIPLKLTSARSVLPRENVFSCNFKVGGGLIVKKDGMITF